MGTWYSDIGFNYDDLFPCTAGEDLFPCCVNIHGIVSTHVQSVVCLTRQISPSRTQTEKEHLTPYDNDHLPLHRCIR